MENESELRIEEKGFRLKHPKLLIFSTISGIEKKPASAFDIFHEFRYEVFTKVSTKETRMQLHVPLQDYVEEHLDFSLSLSCSLTLSVSEAC